MFAGLPPGLQAILQKLGLGPKGPDALPVTRGSSASLTHGSKDRDDKPNKGTVLQDDRLLAGVGFNPSDKPAPIKNQLEKANIERFLKESDLESKPGQGEVAAQTPGETTPRDKKEAELGAKGHEAREGAAAEREERLPAAPRDDAKDELKREAKTSESKEEKERREQRERDRDRGGQRREQDQGSEEEQPGGAWVAPETIAEDGAEKHGLYDRDVMGERSRCAGHAEDGSRCLRKPLEGSTYCREHGA